MIERLVLRLNSTYGLVPPTCGPVRHAPPAHDRPNSAAIPNCSMALPPQPMGLAPRDKAVTSMLV
jgi:hypothetical protein